MYFKKTTIKVSPRHPEMRDFIERIPEVFEQEGQCVYIGRNVIKAFWIKVNGEDKEVMVKRYRQPYFVQRIHYTLFRPTKACRAYEYSFKLQANGLLPPKAMDMWRQGLWDFSSIATLYLTLNIVLSFLSN